MPWGLNPPQGHPILGLRLDGAVLAMVVREASGRRSGGGGSRKKATEGRGRGGAGRHRKGRPSRDGPGLFAGASGNDLGSGPGGAASTERGETTSGPQPPMSSTSSGRRFGRGDATRTKSFSSRQGRPGRGGQGSMTEGAVTLTVASIRAEGSDAGVDKSRGVMLPILAVFPRRKHRGADDRRAAESGSDVGGAPLADNPANNNTADDSFIADMGAASSSVSRGPVLAPGEGSDAFEVTPAFLPPPPPGPPAQCSVREPGGGLEVSARWTLEPLHGRGGGFSAEPGPRRRRGSTTSNSGSLYGGSGGGGGGGGGEDGTATSNRMRSSSASSGVRQPWSVPSAGRGGAVGVGLVKRSMDIRLGRVELWPDPPVLGRISHLIRATVGAKDLSRGLSRRERVRKVRRERGLSERPPGGEGAVWPPVDDPLEELTELVWPSSELPALEVRLSVDEAACLLSFHGRPLSELQLKRGLTIGVETYRQGLGRRAMECRGLLRGLLLWDRTGSASGELACAASVSTPPAARTSARAGAADGSAEAGAATTRGFLDGGETEAFLLPRGAAEEEGGVGSENGGVELQWLFTGRISQAEARAEGQARGVSPADPATPHGSRNAGREPRPPILRARFSGARVVYLQRFTMEQASIPRLCLFRPPLRRRLPTTGNPTATTTTSDPGDDSPPSPSPSAPASSSLPAQPKQERGRARALGDETAGDGAVRGGRRASVAVARAVVFFIYVTCLFGDSGRLFTALVRLRRSQPGTCRALERLEALEAELMVQEMQETLAERKTRAGLFAAEAALTAAERRLPSHKQEEQHAEGDITLDYSAATYVKTRACPPIPCDAGEPGGGPEAVSGREGRHAKAGAVEAEVDPQGGQRGEDGAVREGSLRSAPAQQGASGSVEVRHGGQRGHHPLLPLVEHDRRGALPPRLDGGGHPASSLVRRGRRERVRDVSGGVGLARFPAQQQRPHVRQGSPGRDGPHRPARRQPNALPVRHHLEHHHGQFPGAVVRVPARDRVAQA
ncbi:unnamed protein product [Scytosiphon promiscuus]